MTERTLPQTANALGFSSVEDYVALADAIAALRRAMRRAARTADPSNPLSVAQLELLSCLAEHPGARPGELARLLHLAPNSVATLTTALSASNFIHRSDDPHDRRSISLSLTDRGAAAVSNSQSMNTTILRAALDSLHPGWRSLLAAAIPAVQELIRAIDSRAGLAGPDDGTRGDSEEVESS